MLKSLFHSLILLSLLSIISFAQDATEIVKKADELMKAKSNYSEITMKIIKPDWSREMGMKV